MKAFLFSLVVFMLSGCEFGVGYRHVHHDGHLAYDEVYVEYDAYPAIYADTYPPITSPDICYSVRGIEFCEWTYYSAPYTECLEIWYYDAYWMDWALYELECYAI